jgi:hypothetical protein
MFTVAFYGRRNFCCKKRPETFSDSSLEDFQAMFEAAANERDLGDTTYNTQLGNKLIRILWGNY